MPDRPLIEVCVGSVDDALAAAEAGADRLELCGALELGGLTPSIGLAERVLGAVSIPVVVMLRPRAGGFAYNEREFDCLLVDAERLLAAGADGMVFGPLTQSGQIDSSRVERLVALAGGKQTVFHKAFDGLADLSAGLETLIDLGVGRVLTSGGAPDALAGAESLRALNEQAAGRIEILAGGGVTEESVSRLVKVAGCQSVHLGASTGVIDPSVSADGAAAFCDLERLARGVYRAVDGNRVRAIIARLGG